MKPTPKIENPTESPNLLENRVEETESHREYDSPIGYLGNPRPTLSSDATIPSPSTHKERKETTNVKAQEPSDISHLIDDEGKFHQLVVHQLEKV